MRTQQEIVKRMADHQEVDFFGFETGIYLEFLDFEHAKMFLKDDATEKEWQEVCEEPTREIVLAKMKDYVEFAWGKANNCRGISSSRSIMHYQAWIWLLGDEDKLPTVFDDDYCYYGKPQLVAICEHYGWDWKNHDNDHWTNCESSNGITAEVALHE